MYSSSAAQASLPPSPSSQENTHHVSDKKIDGDRSETSLDNVHSTGGRDVSLSSYGSFGSGQLRVRNAIISPSQSVSVSNLYLAESPPGSLHRRTSSKQASHRSSWGTEIIVPPRHSDPSTFLLSAGPLEDVDLNVKGARADCGGNSAHAYSFINDPDLSLHVTQEMVARSIRDQENSRPSSMMTKTTMLTTHSLKRWISTLRRKNSKNIEPLKVRQERWSLDDFEEPGSARPSLLRRQTINSHRKTSSWSSSGFAEVVKLARAGLNTLNVAPPGRRNRKSILRSSDISSRVSHSGNRTSTDSGHGSTYLIDEAAWARGIQRRRTLEELVSSEESYISDLKVLVNVVPPYKHQHF